MLSSYIMPPRFTAELYRAMGDIPGVTIKKNAVDPLGRHGIGFRFHPPRSTSSCQAELLRCPAELLRRQAEIEVIVSRRTYTYLGGNFFRNLGTALVRQALVSGPGVRP
jgi:hypothetical protein